MATEQLTQRQVVDGAINDAKVQAGANIALSKIAGGTSLIKQDGTVAMTGALNLGNQAITNVATPSANNDAVNKGYVDQAVSNLNSIYKYYTVSARTTGDINLANPGTNIFDSFTMANGETLLVNNQTAPAQNGVYVFNGSGVPLTRATYADSWNEIIGSLVTVIQGTAGDNQRFTCISNSGGTLGTTAITYQADSSGSLSNTNFIDYEVPAGAVNSVNTSFTLGNTPVTGSVKLFINGLRQTQSASYYSVTGSTVTITDAPLTGDRVYVEYRK
jgi:hypothetical protein